MVIVCPACLSAYRLPAAAREKVPESVRCAQCGKLFEPVEVADAPALVLPGETGPARTRSAPVLPAQRPVRVLPSAAPPRSAGGRRALPAIMAVVAALGLAGAAGAERDRLVQRLPATGRLFAALGFPVAGLQLGKVETALSTEGPVKVLTLQTSITNTRSTDVTVPNVTIVVRDDAKQSLYRWTAPAPQKRLAPGEAVSFHSRLVSPPPNGHDLVVSFADEADGTVALKAKQ